MVGFVVVLVLIVVDVFSDGRFVVVVTVGPVGVYCICLLFWF